MLAPELPTVSVVIPVLDERAHIEECLESVLRQDYPAELVEIVVADGGSTDGTREIVAEFAARHPRVRLVDNPRRNQAAGLNVAIASTSGEIVARLDGHSAWGTSHLITCVELLRSTGADNVGGRMEAVGATAWASAAGRATASWFGVGGARFHYATRAQTTDTVFLGCFRRDALERVGLFDETCPPHEDYELNLRIRQSGGTVVFSPEIVTRYWGRGSWQELARQYFAYGRAKTRVARRSPAALRPYHLAPPALLLATIPAPVALRTRAGRRAVALAALTYAALCVAEGLRAGRGAPGPVRRRVPLVFPVLHVCWGAGFLAGLRSHRQASFTGDRPGSPR